jgi:hypothetical protein
MVQNVRMGAVDAHNKGGVSGEAMGNFGLVTVLVPTCL